MITHWSYGEGGNTVMREVGCCYLLTVTDFVLGGIKAESIKSVVLQLKVPKSTDAC